jgi:hypothetical protein
MYYYAGIRFFLCAKKTNADFETTINATRPAVSLLYDPKGKFKLCHHDLNMLRVKLATSKDASLSRIPPSDHPFATFRV